MPDGDPARVLFVCTGNVCRSPFAERLLVARLRAALGSRAAGVAVSSAGTGALVGSPMDPDTVAVLRECAGSEEGFVARHLEAAHVREASLVLTASRAHRAAVVSLVPRAARHTFTIREFARLAAAVDPAALDAASPLDPAGRVAALAAEAAALRGTLPPVPPAEDDVVDPYRRPARVHWDAGLLIARALERPVDLITGSVRSPRH